MVHEWALADSIIIYLLNKGVRKAKKLIVKIGALQSIDKEVLSFALNELSRVNTISIENIEILEEAPTLKCYRCGYEWSINVNDINDEIRESIHFLPESIYAYYKCPRCKSIDFEITKGRGLGEVLVENYE